MRQHVYVEILSTRKVWRARKRRKSAPRANLASWVGRRFGRIPKLTRTYSYWRHQRAQWEYEARSCYWIWLGEYSSHDIFQIYLNNGCSLELIIASRTIYLFLSPKTAAVLICFFYARLSTSTSTTTSHDLHVLLLALYFSFTKRNPRKALKLQRMLHSYWWLNFLSTWRLTPGLCWKGNIKANQKLAIRNLKYHSITDHVLSRYPERKLVFKCHLNKNYFWKVL